MIVDKIEIIENYFLKKESEKNPYYDIKIKITDVTIIEDFISISYYKTLTSKLDVKWSLEKHQTEKLKGTFESIFIANLRQDKLNQLGI